jgi:hypothetical protein
MRRTIEIEYASIVDVCGHGRQPHKNELDARFSFPDRRHSFTQECIRECCVDPWSVRGRHTKMNWTPDYHFLIVVTPFNQECILECCVDPWSVRGRHTKMNWTPDYHFLIVVTPFNQECILECCVDPWSVRGRHTKMNWTPDLHFLIVVTPFIQKCIQECLRHLGLISCPPYLPFLRSVSRSAPSFCPSNIYLSFANSIVECHSIFYLK